MLCNRAVAKLFEDKNKAHAQTAVGFSASKKSWQIHLENQRDLIFIKKYDIILKNRLFWPLFRTFFDFFKIF
jgi:hypothetical protein